MKKHFFGFALFSLIITAAIIYSMFKIVNVEEVTDSRSYSTKMPDSCWRMKRERKELNVASPFVNQVVFNAKAKKFSWELAAPKTDSAVVLHFFIKDEKGTRYIGSEQGLGNERVGELNLSSSYSSLDNLGRNANLYVIAKTFSSAEIYNSHDKNSEPQFDTEKAVPVLINLGK